MAAASMNVGCSNLEMFLSSVTPSISSQFLPPSDIHGLNSSRQPPGKDKVEFFTLHDLWQCYDELSAYGVGVPVVLERGQIVKQYYVPYLSAIQIYTNKSLISLRQSKDDSDSAEFASESCSDESDSDKLSRTLSDNSSRAWDTTSDESVEQDGGLVGSWPSMLGNLYFQYCEYASPYWRVPLFDRINQLASNYPGLLTLKSVELSPASWMAVAWYPIYHIPSQRNVKDLSTCFLTYHTLSSSFQDTAKEGDDTATKITEKVMVEKSEVNGCKEISLPPFGMCSYRLQGRLWLNRKTNDRETMTCLHNAAHSWLKQLTFDHHDFNFFLYHSTM